MTTNLDRYWNQPRGLLNKPLSPEAMDALAKDSRWRPEHTTGHPTRPLTAGEILTAHLHPDARTSDTTHHILQAVTRHCRAHGTTTTRAIALVTGETVGKTRHHLHTLEDAGIITRTRGDNGTVIWALADQAVQA